MGDAIGGIISHDKLVRNSRSLYRTVTLSFLRCWNTVSENFEIREILKPY